MTLSGLQTPSRLQNLPHLQTVSGYSLRYGTASPAALVERAVDQGATALALTDRDGVAGAIRFGQACISGGIAPIIGVDIAIEPLHHRSVEIAKKTPARGGVSIDQRWPRILLYAHGRGGWRSLCRLLSRAHAEAAARDERGKPRLTRGLLAPYLAEGDLFLLHGANSELSLAMANRRDDVADALIDQWRSLLPAGQMGIAVTSHQGPGDGPYSTSHAARMARLAQQKGLPAVLTNAVRYLDRSDAPVADLLDAIRRLVPLDLRHVDRRSAEGYFKSPQEMGEVAEEIALAGGGEATSLLSATRRWAEELALDPGYDLGIGSIHLPEPAVVGCSSESEMSHLLRERSRAGLTWRYGNASTQQWSVIETRLEEELHTISTLGYESYFLTVADVAQMARERGIRVAARGSGAGSLICHALGISGVDPLAHELLMERFCSPLRAALPDIDIDVESARRLEVYDAVFERYAPEGSWPSGMSRCAAVSMVDTYRARHAIRDTGAALGMPPSEIDLLAKSFPRIRARDLRQAMRDLPELRSSGLGRGSDEIEVLIGLAQRLDKLPRHLAMHPCAVVISDGALLDRVPTETSAQGYPMVSFDKDDVEAIGLLKLDILGVRMQSALAYAVKEISHTENLKIDIDQLPLDDAQAFDLIKSTRTLGLFQVESPGQRELVGKFAPETFNDLIIDISLFRPGPVKSDMITPFLQARQGWRLPQSIHPDLEPILASTQGVVVFHEQVIRIIAQMTGCTLAEGDEYRRSLGDREAQSRIRQWFYAAAIDRGYPIQVVERIWEVLASFASFGFCKAHAAAFALPTYQSAWLKAHYPAAFIAGILTHDPGMYPKRLTLSDARYWGIAILPVDIHHSMREYVVEKVAYDEMTPAPSTPAISGTGEVLSLPDGRGYGIRLALADIQGINSEEIDRIIEGRPYRDLADFVRRSRVSRPVVERLILVGAFDALHGISSALSGVARIRGGVTRRDLLMHYAELEKWLSRHKSVNSDQLSLDMASPPLYQSGLPDMSAADRVRAELEVMGLDATCHVVDFYRHFLDELGVVMAGDLLASRAKSTLLVAGVKVATQTPPIRSGRRVIFLTLDDGTGCADAAFFEDAQGPYAATLFHSWMLIVQGEVRRTGPRGLSIRATGCWELTQLHKIWRTGGMAAVREAMGRESPVPERSGSRTLWHSSSGSSGR
jgi:error-prone DNA polymerase